MVASARHYRRSRWTQRRDRVHEQSAELWPRPWRGGPGTCSSRNSGFVVDDSDGFDDPAAIGGVSPMTSIDAVPPVFRDEVDQQPGFRPCRATASRTLAGFGIGTVSPGDSVLTNAASHAGCRTPNRSRRPGCLEHALESRRLAPSAQAPDARVDGGCAIARRICRERWSVRESEGSGVRWSPNVNHNLTTKHTKQEPTKPIARSNKRDAGKAVGRPGRRRRQRRGSQTNGLYACAARVPWPRGCESADPPPR